MALIKQADDLLRRYEQKVLFTYDDSKYPTKPYKSGPIGGTLTIGLGHTGPDAAPGRTITDAQAEAWYAADVAKHEARVRRLVKVPLSESQLGALVVWDFNTEALETSTLLKKLNKGQYDAVPAEMQKWNHTHINGKLVVSDGLTERRAAEVALWQAVPMAVTTLAPSDTRRNPSAVGVPAPKVTTPAEWLTPGNVPTVGGVGAGILAAVSGNTILSVVLGIIALAGFGIGAYFYIQSRRVPK